MLMKISDIFSGIQIELLEDFLSSQEDSMVNRHLFFQKLEQHIRERNSVPVKIVRGFKSNDKYFFLEMTKFKKEQSRSGKMVLDNLRYLLLARLFNTHEPKKRNISAQNRILTYEKINKITVTEAVSKINKVGGIKHLKQAEILTTVPQMELLERFLSQIT